MGKGYSIESKSNKVKEDSGSTNGESGMLYIYIYIYIYKNAVVMNTILTIITWLVLEHIDEMDELNTYLRIGENIVGQCKVMKCTGFYVDITKSSRNI